MNRKASLNSYISDAKLNTLGELASLLASMAKSKPTEVSKLTATKSNTRRQQWQQTAK